MIFCTNCGKANDDAARICHNCGSWFGGQAGSTPFQTAAPPNAGEQPPQPQQSQQPQPPPVNPWATPQPGAPWQSMQPAFGSGSGLLSTGEKREPVLALLLPFVTCGIYVFYWWYVTGTDIKNALGREDINPGLDLLLGILTCGIYYIYLSYRDSQMLLLMQDRVGLPRNDISIISLVLYLVFAPVTLFLIQTELNKIWDASR
ncbi:MAG TPA: DUF4234 domain-containing protein [Pyrinomonadaceae bacterium]|jgi:hypothetical protein|nr:DUF4234 domain-containing protein [Pyrinomonadaceae bacterium]